MTSLKTFVNVSLSVLIMLFFVVTLGILGGYSTGLIDLSSEPTVHAEENTTGVPQVKPSEHRDIDGYRLEKQIFSRVNDERADVGRDPFIHSERVRLIARIHSKDMADRGFFNHTNPEGEGSQERHERFNGCSVTNENIAKWGNPPTTNESDIAQVIVEGWADSSSHNKSMMTSYDNVAGVGVYVTENKSIYVTMNFCREHPNA